MQEGTEKVLFLVHGGLYETKNEMDRMHSIRIDS